MARVLKLLQRARHNPRDVRFSDLLALVAGAAFTPLRERGAIHRRFLRPDAVVFLNLQALADGKAKDVQVLQSILTLSRLDDS